MPGPFLAVAKVSHVKQPDTTTLAVSFGATPTKKPTKTYHQCQTCKAISERYDDGTGVERHEPLCEEVRRLSSRLTELEDMLVLAGILAEFRP